MESFPAQKKSSSKTLCIQTWYMLKIIICIKYKKLHFKQLILYFLWKPMKIYTGGYAWNVSFFTYFALILILDTFCFLLLFFTAGCKRLSKDCMFLWYLFLRGRLREREKRKRQSFNCYHCVLILLVSSHNNIWIKPEQILLGNCMELMRNKETMLHFLLSEQWPCCSLIFYLQLIPSLPKEASYIMVQSSVHCFNPDNLFCRFKQLIKESPFVFHILDSTNIYLRNNETFFV